MGSLTPAKYPPGEEFRNNSRDSWDLKELEREAKRWS
jgi:hypothetical protein